MPALSPVGKGREGRGQERLSGPGTPAVSELKELCCPVFILEERQGPLTDRPRESGWPTPRHLQGRKARAGWAPSTWFSFRSRTCLSSGETAPTCPRVARPGHSERGASWGEGQPPPSPPSPAHGPTHTRVQDLASKPITQGHFTLVQSLWSHELDRAVPPPIPQIRTLRQVGYEAQSVHCKVPPL